MQLLSVYIQYGHVETLPMPTICPYSEDHH